jgi:DNA polymerase-3 subunit gamma/tau
MLDEIIRTITSNDLCAVFEKAGELVDSGKDVKQILVTLQGHLRDLLIASVARNPQALTDVSPERFAQLKEQARWFHPPCLLQMLDILADAERDLRYTNQHRLLLETAFWKILPVHLLQTPVAAPAPKSVEKGKAAVPAAAPPVPAPESAADTAAPPVRETAEPETAAAVPAPSAPEPAAPQPAPRFSADIDLEVIRRAWPRVVRRITQVSRSANGIFTEDVYVMALEGNVVVVGFPDEFKRSRVDKPKGHETLRQALAAELGVEGLKIRCVLATPPTETDSPHPPVDPPPPAAPPPSAPAKNGAPKPPPSIPEAATPSSLPESKGADPEEDFLELVIEELDGKLVDE